MAQNNPNIIQVKVERVTLDTSSNRFVVILRDENYKRWLPIVVGPAEAQAIALFLERVTPPRPMTHDLMKRFLDNLEATVIRIVINDLRENTYYAAIEIKNEHGTLPVDARPSDAIALALRSNAPIFVDTSVMDRAAINEELDSINIDQEEDEIKRLNIQMKDAVDEERYEDAAHIRDMIHELEEKLKLKRS
ncbi:bifunctional nuclease family protein [bacterium]|nr:bifunctional nuclease family protein [bacterium]